MLEPYTSSVLKRAIRTPKLYFRDTGLAAYLTRWLTPETESEIDLIIEENGVLYPIEIKQSAKVSADEPAAFTVLDRIENKKRGTGAIICMCPQPGALRENILQLPVRYI